MRAQFLRAGPSGAGFSGGGSRSASPVAGDSSTELVSCGRCRELGGLFGGGRLSVECCWAGGGGWLLAGGVFEGGEAFAGQGGFLGAREVVDEILESGLRESGLLEVDQRERFLVERGRHLVGAGIVGLDLLEFLHGLLGRLGGFVALAGVAEPASQRDVRLADPVLSASGELVIGIAPEELAETRDRERVASLAEVDVCRLIDILRLQRSGGLARGRDRDRSRRGTRGRATRCAGRCARRSAGGRRGGGRSAGGARRGPRGRRRRGGAGGRRGAAHLAIYHVELGVELVHAA